MKQYLTKGALALVLGGCLTSCSHEEFDISSYVADKVKAYEQVFVSEFGSIDPNQDWGFGSAANNSGQARRMTRGDHSWNGIHNSTSSSKVPCGVNWTDTIQFTIPSGLVTIEADTKIAPNNNYYVPATFNGKVNFDNNYNGNIYVAGTVTGYEGGNQGTVNIYILENGSWTSSFTSGTTTFYNNGYLTLGGSDLQNTNIAAIYNAGSFTYNGTNTNSDTYLYSTGTVELTADLVDFKLKCDVHNTMKTKNIKIQNGTAKYICGIDATGYSVENVDGPLVTANIKANYFSADGNPIYLTEGGHIDVATTIKIYNAACKVYAVQGSTALVETKDFTFENDNDLDRTFSDEIHFNITGSIDCKAATNLPGGDSSKRVYTVAEYIAQFGDPNERINTGNASGSPACGEAWSIGTGGGGGETELPIEDPKEGTPTATKKYYRSTQLIDQGRVFCEDLGQISSNDLDFNDVVFDAYIYEIKEYTETIDADGEVINTDTTSVQHEYEITLWAAGGTLTLSVAEQNVKNAFGTTTGTLVNTASANDEAYGNPWTECKPVTLKGTGDYEKIVEIPIIIQYGNGEVLVLDATKGEAPHKILVPVGTPWAKERQKVDEAYQDFKNYVNNSSVKFWDGAKDDSKLYHHPEDNAKARSTEVMVDLLKTEEGSSSSEGGYNGTPVLSRERR